MVGVMVQKPSVRGPRPLLGCCSWNDLTRSKGDDPKWLRIKSRAARRGTLEEGAARAAASAAQVSLHCGSAASNRQLLGSAPALRRRGGARAPLRARGCSWPRLLPGFRQRSGNGCPRSCGGFEKDLEWRRLSRQEWEGEGEPAGSGWRGGGGRGAGWLATARLQAGALRLDEVLALARPGFAHVFVEEHLWVVLATGAWPAAAQGTAQACPASGA